MNRAVKQCLLAFNEAPQNLPMRRTEPFVYSMDSDSQLDLGPTSHLCCVGGSGYPKSPQFYGISVPRAFEG